MIGTESMEQQWKQNVAGSSQDWGSSIDQLLDDLLETQKSMLQLLGIKKKAMVDRDVAAIESLQPQEEALCQKLAECHSTRQHILDRAAEAKLPSKDILGLTKTVITQNFAQFDSKITAVKQLTEQLRQHSLTNWIIAQRNLLHVSQLLEIIATGGNKSSTYGDGKASAHNGFVLDQEA